MTPLEKVLAAALVVLGLLFAAAEGERDDRITDLERDDQADEERIDQLEAGR